MVLFAHRVDPAEVDRLVEFARRYELGAHKPRIATLVECPWSIDERDVEFLREEIGRFVIFHRDYPFRVMPDGLLDGEFAIGEQQANGAPLRLTRAQIARHLLIVGATGSGKTTWLRILIKQLLAAGIKLIIPDKKDDLRSVAARDPRFLILHANAPFNPLQRPPHLSAGVHISTIVQRFAAAYYGGEHLKQVLTTALERAFGERPNPSWADVARILATMAAKNDTFAWRDAVHGLLLRIKRFASLWPGMYACRDGIAYDVLFAHSVYLPITQQTEADQFLLSLLVDQLFLWQRSRQARTTLDYVVVVDEGLPDWTVNTTNIGGQPLLASLLPMVREWGIGVVVTSSSMQLSPVLKANVFLQIALTVTNGQESNEVAQTFGMTSEEHAFYSTQLQLGGFIAKYADGWQHPICAIFPNDEADKHISEAEWEAATERTSALAPIEPESPTISPNDDISPSSGIELPPPSHPILTPALRAFVTPIAESGLRTVMETYDALHLKPMQGNRLQKQAKAIGLVSTHRITVGGGRGKEATALVATPLAYQMLGIKKPHLGRGSGPQHAWILRRLSQLILNATIEVGGADIGIAYNADVHGQFIEALRSTGGHGVALNTGAAIAIEVELDPSRTLKNNLERDKSFALVIVGVRRAQLEAARRIAKRYANTIVVDIFALLDALQETSA